MPPFDRRDLGTADELLDLTRTFHDLLAQHPDAMVAAIAEDGLFVPMPASVPLDRHRVVLGRSAIDMVVSSDKLAVIDAWERCRAGGGAAVTVHLVVDPDRAVMMTFFDARAAHGTFLGLFVPTSDGHRTAAGLGAASLAVMPRTARVRKTDMAVVSEIDGATTLILGWTPEQIVGRRSLEFVHPDDQERAISNWMEMLTAPGHDQRVRLRHLRADGTYLWMELTNRKLLEPDGQHAVVTEMLDISEELAAQEALRAREQLLRRLAEALPLGVVHVGVDGSISYANERAGAITGARSAADLTAQFRHIVAADEPSLAAAIGAVLRNGEDRDLPVRLDLGPFVGLRRCTLGMRALTDEHGAVSGAIVCISDVTEQEQMTSELERRATYDSLTGCYNRQTVISTLEVALRAPGRGVGIIFVDLDGFKQVNDTLGHAAGDAVLVGVAGMLRAAVRPGDIVGRVGGDEFLVVCADISDAAGVHEVAARIDELLSSGVQTADAPIAVGASLGIAHTTMPASSSDGLVAEADAAMYALKRGRRADAPTPTGASGPDRPSSLRTRSSDRELELRRAIDGGELEVHFQPVVALSDRSVHGFEALTRWRHAGEVIPAASFIGLAERTGLIVDIGAWMIDEVCRQVSRAGFDERTRWFVNMSPTELAVPDAARRALAALERHGLDPKQLAVEVTEHADLSSSAAAREAIAALSAAGAAIALDDFGTGYSSLALLRSLPVDCIKIDRSFIADVAVDPAARHLLDVCVDLARRLRLGVIAEGVETQEQADALTDAGIDLVQGWLVSAAKPLDELRSLVAPMTSTRA